MVAARVTSSHDSSAPNTQTPPPITREFRAAWVATVLNIDWPSKMGLDSQTQQNEAIRILDRSKEIGLNAIILQVRPSCDAFYDSKLEPWSEYLTGTMGEAPAPHYDPLKFWIHEAHLRGIELHAWFNPYRARHPSGKSPICKDHVCQCKPALVRKYGSHLWMDPGEEGTADHTIGVIMDVVKRYDIDAVHMDDYFYPYKEKNAAGQIIDFPDDGPYQKYRHKGGALDKEDWRRDNVNRFVERLYATIKRVKPEVKFGISPFGIWRPGNPATIQGMDQFKDLYADARKWIRDGNVDYWTPQLYWSVRKTPQSYPVLLRWWSDQNLKQRHLWPGNYTSRVGDGQSGWNADEIVEQVNITRGQIGASGNVHFSMKTIMDNRLGIADRLKSIYREPALIPASPWLSKRLPSSPTVSRTQHGFSWRSGDPQSPWLWVVQTLQAGKWTTRIFPGAVVNCNDVHQVSKPESIAVYAVDRCSNVSSPTIINGG